MDSAILAAEAAGVFREDKKIRGAVGLERLCRELVGVRIQDRGEGAYDSLEDVLATREAVF